MNSIMTKSVSGLYSVFYAGAGARNIPFMQTLQGTHSNFRINADLAGFERVYIIMCEFHKVRRYHHAIPRLITYEQKN